MYLRKIVFNFFFLTPLDGGSFSLYQITMNAAAPGGAQSKNSEEFFSSSWF